MTVGDLRKMLEEMALPDEMPVSVDVRIDDGSYRSVKMNAGAILHDSNGQRCLHLSGDEATPA